eukprot:CAMPEP_0185771270 /NCGR_PEP_ID=MMETSP1174-20130828/63938_1 /TAXON_ID=35687 /ORGANISM="Dictyocha speculum, Strain CCMP1381" /LENGTH=97 /DNA_ID=CAMNT_0028457073 /DNA_START=109 /DNA_END=402 /DNA_ORIENTATION=+
MAIVVQVEIEPARVPQFLDVMNYDAEESRKEEGCFRFDLLRDQSDPNKFIFYEVYKDANAVDVHKSMPHYKAWSDFKDAGGVVSQTAIKADAINFTY